MPGPWSTDANIKARLASAMGLASADDVPTHLTTAIEDGNARGYQWLLERLLGRGYSLAQLDMWNGRVAWSKDAGTYFALELANLDDDRSLQAKENLWRRLSDREQGIDAIQLYDSDGNVLEPGGDTNNVNVGYGAVLDGDDDRFTMDTVL